MCKKCKNSLNRKESPKHYIGNNYTFGTTPECLLCLTEIELAFINPIRTYGYCFSYSGGIQKQIKGGLSYYKIGISNVVTSVAQFEGYGLSNNILILIYGHITEEQRKIIKKKLI